MALPHITPRRAAPYLVRSAYGAHILVRMWRLSKLPPGQVPLHLFLLKNTDVILVLAGGPFVWRLAKQRYQRRARLPRTTDGTQRSLIQHAAHQLRQVFTVLLLGLGIIRRRAIKNETADIPRIVDRLQKVIADGIQAVNTLDPPNMIHRNGRERELEG